MKRTAQVLGVEFFVGDLEVAATAVVARARAGIGGYACLTGAHGTVLAHYDEQVRLALVSAWQNFADGASVAWVQRRTGHGAARRVAGPDLMPLVIERGVEHGLRHFLFGSTDAVLADLRARLIARAPGTQIVGAFSPPFRYEVGPETESILDDVRTTAPDVVWIGLGTPKQELWMLSNAHRLEPALVMGVGAAFDFNVGKLRRAPLWMQRSGLEWLHRAAKEPRLRSRYLRVNGDFIVRALAQVTQERLQHALPGRDPAVTPPGPTDPAGSWRTERVLRRSRWLGHAVRRRLGEDLSPAGREAVGYALHALGAGTSRARVLPDYVIIGGQRCGTTSLHRYLLQHPCIGASYRKEVGYFDDNYWRGQSWYRAHFPTALYAACVQRATGHRFVVGESTPYYLFHPAVPERMQELMPDVKLVVLLRNPVDRAYSSWKHQRREGLEYLSFEHALEQEGERLEGEEELLLADARYVSPDYRHYSYLARGLYADQLERWFSMFSRERFLILPSEDLFADPDAVVLRVHSFLDVPAAILGPYPQTNATEISGMTAATRERLAEYFAEPNERLYRLLGTDFGWNRPAV